MKLMGDRELELEAALEWFLHHCEENIDVLTDAAEDDGDELELKLAGAWVLLRGEE